MNPKIIALIIGVLLVGYLMIRRAPNAKVAIISLMALVILGAVVLYGFRLGPALLIKSPAEERIAFISNDGGRSDVWTMRMDGSDRLKVTNDPAHDRAPSWSPDGLEIASVSDKTGSYELILSAWTGRYSHRMTTSAGAKDWPVWANNDEICFVAGGVVRVISRRGGEAEMILPPHELKETGVEGWFSKPYAYAAFSRSEKYILGVQDTDVGRMVYALSAVDGEVKDPMKAQPLGIIVAQYADAAWSPQQDTFAAAFMDRDGSGGLWIADVEVPSGRDLFASKTHGSAKPAWSPDGSRIAFEYWKMDNGSPDKCLGIYTVGLSGGAPRLLVSGDAREPSWSADGNYVVYSAPGKDGTRAIWRVNSDGSGAINLTEGMGDSNTPVCSPALTKKA